MWAPIDEDPSLFFGLRGITMDDIITQTVADITQTLFAEDEHQSADVLDDVDLGDVFGIRLDDPPHASPGFCRKVRF